MRSAKGVVFIQIVLFRVLSSQCRERVLIMITIYDKVIYPCSQVQDSVQATITIVVRVHA